jgi:membrane dipeptidase
MNRIVLRTVAILLTFPALLFSCRSKPMSEEQRMDLATEICQNHILLDSHIDWPESIYSSPRNISEENSIGDFDLVRARKGGLNAVLSVLYIDPGFTVMEGRQTFDSMYHIVTAYAKEYPDRFAGATDPKAIRKNFRRDLLSIPLCLENGIIIGDQLEYVKHLKDLGIVYITLNHSKPNQISDANMDSDRPWNGLSPFGKKVVEEMNRQRIIIDISHSTDSTVSQVLRLSRAPIVATHSSCRYFTPGYDRNLPDELIKSIAEKDGVVMVAFGSMFLDPVCSENINQLLQYFDSTGISYRSPEGMLFIQDFMQHHKVLAEARQVADHIDHIVKIAGIDHVGLGSDYDGIGPSQPIGLPDVSSYPVIVSELLRRGYKEKEIQKILGKNFLRVWDEVIAVSESLR